MFFPTQSISWDTVSAVARIEAQNNYRNYLWAKDESMTLAFTDSGSLRRQTFHRPSSELGAIFSFEVGLLSFVAGVEMWIRRNVLTSRHCRKSPWPSIVRRFSSLNERERRNYGTDKQKGWGPSCGTSTDTTASKTKLHSSTLIAHQLTCVCFLQKLKCWIIFF